MQQKRLEQGFIFVWQLLILMWTRTFIHEEGHGIKSWLNAFNAAQERAHRKISNPDKEFKKSCLIPKGTLKKFWNHAQSKQLPPRSGRCQGNRTWTAVGGWVLCLGCQLWDGDTAFCPLDSSSRVTSTYSRHCIGPQRHTQRKKNQIEVNQNKQINKYGEQDINYG